MIHPTIIHLPETGSTNNYAVELLTKERPPEGCVVVTSHQTRGKGTDTNSWESEINKNLTFSIILYPAFAADQQFILNKAISLGIYDFLKTELPQSPVSIKWPNDIYIGDKKVCGILIQNSIIGYQFDYVVAGIGLNVNQEIFISDAPNPVSLKMITKRDYNLEDVLEKLLNSIFEKYSLVQQNKGRLIENEYYQAMYRLMEWHRYLVNKVEVTARITGTSPYGQLLLQTQTHQELTCDLKDVKFVI